MNGIPVSELRRTFSYDRDTGCLMRGSRRAGFRDGRYTRVFITYGGKKRRFFVHRVVWCLTHGEWPVQHIDHKDGDGHNNRLDNLRLATMQQNMRNTGPKKCSKLGIKGVRVTPYGKYQARITISHKEYYLGTFDTAEEAQAVFSQAALRVHGSFAHPCLTESSGG